MINLWYHKRNFNKLKKLKERNSLSQIKTNKDGIKIHSLDNFEMMRLSCNLAAKTLDMIYDYVKPGVTTDKLDSLIHEFIHDNGAIPATLGYRGYPKSSCISINHVVCHGIPNKKILKNGDILNIDVTCILNGWYGDTSRMYVAGETSLKAKRLINITHKALFKGINVVKPGNHFGDIGAEIQNFVESEKMSVVRDFCGHGLGEVFHSAPNVLHYGKKGTGPVFEEGMFFTIEPMVNLGKPDTKVLSDNWTAVTKDKSLSAQFEHSIGVIKDGYEIFTKSPKDIFFSYK